MAARRQTTAARQWSRGGGIEVVTARQCGITRWRQRTLQALCIRGIGIFRPVESAPAETACEASNAVVSPNVSAAPSGANSC